MFRLALTCEQEPFRTKHQAGQTTVAAKLQELPKLQARAYLNAAQCAFDNLTRQTLMGYDFRFHVIGILAPLRAVQHVLANHDPASRKSMAK